MWWNVHRPLVGISAENLQYPWILGTTTKKSIVFLSFTKCLSGTCKNSRFCLFPGMKVSDSCSWAQIISFFLIPFQFLNIVNKKMFIPFLFPNFGNEMIVLGFRLTCASESHSRSSLKSGAKKWLRPWQDSNLQSPDPKSGALSFRPYGPTWQDLVGAQTKEAKLRNVLQTNATLRQRRPFGR